MVIKTREPGDAFKKQVSDFVPLVRKKRPWREETQQSDESISSELGRSVQGASTEFSEDQKIVSSDLPRTVSEIEAPISAPAVTTAQEGTPLRPSTILAGDSLVSATADTNGRSKSARVKHHRTLLNPNWEPDFSKSYEFVSAFLFDLFGSRHPATMRVYLDLYLKGKVTNNLCVHVKRAALLETLGTTSSSTITRVLRHGESVGLFSFQAFPSDSADVRSGTYIYLKFPWYKNQ